MINGKKISYDTPAYVKGVQKYYQQITGQSDGQQSDTTSQNPSLGQELAQRGTNAVGAVNQAGQGVGELGQGNIGKGLEDVGSGLLQTGGAAAGAVGDVAQKGLELIPGVKSVEGLIGGGVSDLANTPIGQNVISSVSAWAQAHPEVAANLGAAGNIASIIPMFKAASLAVGLGKDALGAAMKDSLTKAAGNEIEGVVSKTAAARDLLGVAKKQGLDPIGTVLKEGLPTVETDGGGVPRYNTENAVHALTTKPEEDALQAKFAEADPTKVSNTIPLAQVRANALSVVEKEFGDSPDYYKQVAETNRIFDDYAKKNGDYVPLSKLNNIGRGLRGSVNWKNPMDKINNDLRYHLGDSVHADVTAAAKAAGIPGVDELNKAMANKINAKKLLKYLNGKSPKSSAGSKFARKVKMALAGGAGEVIGNALGVPGAGTLGGMLLESGAAEPNTPLTRLARTGGLLQKSKSLAKTAPLGLLRQGARTGP